MSNTIKIISTKGGKLTLNNVIPRLLMLEYTNSLTEKAKYQKGFVNSNSYWKNSLAFSHNINIELITISEWKTLEDWNNWYLSKERYEIYRKYSNIIAKEHFDYLTQKNINDDIFLL